MERGRDGGTEVLVYHCLMWSFHFGQFHVNLHLSLSSSLGKRQMALSRLLKFLATLFPHLQNGDKMPV